MPKVETLYICEICGSSHTTSDQAFTCERRHHTIVGAVEPKYLRFCEDHKSAYPNIILVTMSNGHKIEYFRKGSQ